MRIIEQIPCLAAEELNNNALVPFQIVPPMLSRCLHLYININIMASASHYHDDAIFLSLDDLILIIPFQCPLTSILSFQFCSGSLLGLCTLINNVEISVIYGPL